MFALIKKDIIFTKKWILLSVVYGDRFKFCVNVKN